MSSKAVKTRARKPKNEPVTAKDLIAALKFVSLAQRNEGAPYQTHCAIYSNLIAATDGVLSAGCAVQEDLQACPHTLSFLKALEKCGNELAITLLDNSRLSVKSGPFRAHVPCVEFTELISIVPDPSIAALGPSFLKGLEVCGQLAAENAQSIEAGSLLLRQGSIIGTNGYILIEYWHGFDMPPDLALPKAAAAALLRTGKALKSFGYSPSSITFYFEDDSWLKSQLYQDEWPDVSELLALPSNAWPIPDKFFEAVEAVAYRGDMESVFFVDGGLQSHATQEEGNRFEIEGLPTGPIYSGKYLKLLKPIAERIDFATYPDKCFFFGENIRGLLMGRVF